MNGRVCHKAVGFRMVSTDWGTRKLEGIKKVQSDNEFKGADGCKEATVRRGEVKPLKVDVCKGLAE